MTKDKIRILFVGDLVVPTGFSTVLHNIIKPNTEDFDIVGLGVNYKGDPHNLGIPVYPAVGDIYGVRRLIEIINQERIDIIFILNDAWVISYYLEALKGAFKDGNMPKIVAYFPVDSMYHNSTWYRDFDIVNRAFTYTEFGKSVVNQCIPEMNVEIMPHGTDTETFYQRHPDSYTSKVEYLGEKTLEMFGKKEDLFFVLNANRNQPRKRLDITMEGFSIFAKGKPMGVRLYMHTGAVDSSVDIGYISQRYGIDNRLILTNLTRGIQRVPLDRLNLIYNACDIGINTGMGEGWGLTSTEHAVTGAVQIVPNHSACVELFGDCGIVMPTVTNYTFDNSQTVGKLVSPLEVALSLETLYSDKKLREELSEKGMKKFTGKEYRWSYIANQWKTVFEEVANDNSPVPE